MKPKPKFAIGDAAWLFDQACRLPVEIRHRRRGKLGWVYGIKKYGGTYLEMRLGVRDPADTDAYRDAIYP